jgi:energy-coupling factor transporter ATP-binding protein EcfA2
MVKLFCVVVGEKASAFSVKIGESDSISDLKKLIKQKKANDLQDVDADRLDLYLAMTSDGLWLDAGTDVARRLEEGEKTASIEDLTQKNRHLNPTFHLQDVLKRMPKPNFNQIHILVVIPKQKRSTSTPEIISYRPYPEGINLKFPYLSREELVENLHVNVLQTNFVLLSAPAGSGKTSLMTIFAKKHPELLNIFIYCFGTKEDPYKTLATYGLDIIQENCSISNDRDCVFMLDDCQRQYSNTNFWYALIKGSSSWMPKHIHIIISATHMLEVDRPESPVLFGSITSQLTRDHFRISDNEARQLLNLDNGLPLKLRFPTLMEVIIRECNGHFASLRLSCDFLYHRYREVVAPAQEDVFVYYLSDLFASKLGRCFGGGHKIPTGGLELFLIKCLVRDPTCAPLVGNLNDDETLHLLRLKKAGIVEQDQHGKVLFTSPLAERFYSKLLFPNRAYNYSPQSPQELIQKVIESMSASVLRHSVVGTDDFPKEAVFQHLFMTGLSLHTPPTCYICPEMSRVFSDFPHQPEQHINGEIDFYLNGSLRWGIELLVNGDKIGQHMSRFEVNGKYAALGVKDYIVVNLQGNYNRIATNITRYPKRMTIYFKHDFSSCDCTFGTDGDFFSINLKD